MGVYKRSSDPYIYAVCHPRENKKLLKSYRATLIQLLSTSLSTRAVLGSVSTRPCHLENKQKSKFSPELRSKAEAQNETPPSSSQLSASSAPHLYGGQFVCSWRLNQPQRQPRLPSRPVILLQRRPDVLPLAQGGGSGVLPIQRRHLL